jgi:hypothetical protein
MAATRVQPTVTPSKTGAKPGQAPAAVTKPSAAPGTQDATGKKEKRTRAAYVVPEGGLTAVPADYDPRKHKPLPRSAFKDAKDWFELRALLLEKKAASLREQAKQESALGGTKDRQKAKRLINMTKRMSVLMDELKSQGIDVDALLKASGASNGEPETAAPAKA